MKCIICCYWQNEAEKFKRKKETRKCILGLVQVTEPSMLSEENEVVNSYRAGKTNLGSFRPLRGIEPAQPTNPKEMTVLLQLPSANPNLNLFPPRHRSSKTNNNKKDDKIASHSMLSLLRLQKVGPFKVFDVRRILFYEPFFGRVLQKESHLH